MFTCVFVEDAAIGLSLACGGMASCLFTFLFFKLARKGIRARNMEKRAQTTLLKQKLGEIKELKECSKSNYSLIKFCFFLFLPVGQGGEQVGRANPSCRGQSLPPALAAH